MAVPTSETVQLAVLSYLDQSPDGTLADSRELVVDGTPMKGPAEQILVKAAVDSLARREVCIPPILYKANLEEGNSCLLTDSFLTFLPFPLFFFSFLFPLEKRNGLQMGFR